MAKKVIISFILCAIVCFSIFAQTHISVPLGHPVYHVLEQAQMRGLCRFLPSARPYTKSFILSVIEEIMENDETQRFGKLTQQERAIFDKFRTDFTPERDGLDLKRGVLAREHTWNDVYFSSEFGLNIDLSFSGAYFSNAGGFKYADFAEGDEPDYRFIGADHPASGDFLTGLDSGFSLSFIGDMGRNFSYGLTVGCAFLKTPRSVLGQMNTFSHEWVNDREGKENHDWARENRKLTVYGEPLTYFPYTYKMNWDGSVWYRGSLDAASFEGWPETLSFGYYMFPEMGGQLLNGHVQYRVARLDRDWSGMSNNASLVLNQSAQPFLAWEVTFIPFEWITFSALTGILEYGMMMDGSGEGGIKDAAETFQNAFSINMLELNYKNYFHFDFGSATVWPKRFEIGYHFPFQDTFLYQNNVGDFDNSALFSNIMVQYPGLAKAWFSLFVDEMSFGEINRDSIFNLSRMMFSYQFGTTFYLPFLSFSSITLGYTKVEPYNYSHTREDLPWYGDTAMETNWVNRGRSLGHYLPPNSDEILVRFDTMPSLGSKVSLQYQMIRHGAEYGDRAVAGSSLWSELDPWKRSTKPNLRKYFLQDGAYQWMHIFKVRGEYSMLGKTPIRMFGEFGGVYSYFTDIDSSIEPNPGKPYPYSRIDTPQYPNQFSIIGVVGMRIFPKF